MKSSSLAWKFYPKSSFYYALVMLALGATLSLVGSSFWLNLFLSLFISFITVSVLITWIQLRGLVVHAVRVERGFVEQTLYLELFLEEKIGIYRDTLRLQWQDESRVSVELNAFEKKAVRLPVCAKKRGFFSVQSIRIFSDYPLGLFEISKELPLHLTGIAYAKPSEAPRHSRKQAAKNTGQHFEEQSDFDGFRSYHPGDSLKSIAWKNWSKGELLTKIFSKNNQKELIFSATEKDFSEKMVAKLTRYVLDAHKKQQKYGLHLPHVNIKAQWSESHRHRCLQAIATWRAPL